MVTSRIVEVGCSPSPGHPTSASEPSIFDILCRRDCTVTLWRTFCHRVLDDESRGCACSFTVHVCAHVCFPVCAPLSVFESICVLYIYNKCCSCSVGSHWPFSVLFRWTLFPWRICMHLLLRPCASKENQPHSSWTYRYSHSSQPWRQPRCGHRVSILSSLFML